MSLTEIRRRWKANGLIYINNSTHMHNILTPGIIIPFIISSAVALWILRLSFIKGHVAEGVLSILFMAAALLNIYTVNSNPGAYRGLAHSTFLPFYKDFINGHFARNIKTFASIIAIVQLYIGLSMLMENFYFKFGCVAGCLFGIAIAPLGIVAFPSSLFLSIAFVVLLIQRQATSPTV